MRTAVAGATGRIGALTDAALERDGHDVVRISRSHGVDPLIGDGLERALAGVRAVLDATNVAATELDEVAAYVGATTRNLLAAEQGVPPPAARSSGVHGSRQRPLRREA